jgi:tetratricopeptide (TPR) repeat protein
VKRLATSVGLTLILLSGAVGESTPESVLERARAARLEGLPQVVIHELRQTAETISEPGLARPLRIELARCLIEAGRPDEALTALETLNAEDDIEVAFWKAQALAAAGEFDGAMALYEECGRREDFQQRGEALLGYARMLIGKEYLAEALIVLRDVPESSPAWNAAKLEAAVTMVRLKRAREALAELDAMREPAASEQENRRYLLAQARLNLGELDAAFDEFAELKAQDPQLTAGAAVGAAVVRERRKDWTGAEEILERFIQENPRNPYLGRVFEKLDAVYEQEAQQQASPSNSELKKWNIDEREAGRSAYALYYLARNEERLGQMESSERYLRKFLRDHPGHSLEAAARVDLARARVRESDLAAAVRALDGAEETAKEARILARVRFQRAEINFLAGNYEAAARQFRDAMEADDALGEAAQFNSVLAGLLAGEGTQVFQQALRLLENPRFRRSGAADEARLAWALFLARKRADGVDGQLEQLSILAQEPAVRARSAFALAEWRWIRGDHRGAEKELIRVASGGGANPADEAYLAVYLADDGSEVAAPGVAAAAERFLSEHSESAMAAQVRMKWGEALARSGDYLGAREKFEQAAEETDDPDLALTAKFLAGSAAARSMDSAKIEDAIELFEEVADSKSPLGPQARFEQALLRAPEQPKVALGILDRVLGAPANPELRYNALLKKGENLFALGQEDTGRYREAITTWRLVADDEKAPVRFRNDARTKVGGAFAKLGETDGALSAYYQVLSTPRDKEPEFLWYYKAGFEAVELLESQRRFKEAISICQKMAAVEGPRAAEAAERAKRLRTENFIWEN